MSNLEVVRTRFWNELTFRSNDGAPLLLLPSHCHYFERLSIMIKGHRYKFVYDIANISKEGRYSRSRYVSKKPKERALEWGRRAVTKEKKKKKHWQWSRLRVREKYKIRINFPSSHLFQTSNYICLSLFVSAASGLRCLTFILCEIINFPRASQWRNVSNHRITQVISRRPAQIFQRASRIVCRTYLNPEPYYCDAMHTHYSITCT